MDVNYVIILISESNARPLWGGGGAAKGFAHSIYIYNIYKTFFGPLGDINILDRQYTHIFNIPIMLLKYSLDGR